MNPISPIHRKPQFFHSTKKTSQGLTKGLFDAFNNAVRGRTIYDMRNLERELYELVILKGIQNLSSEDGRGITDIRDLERELYELVILKETQNLSSEDGRVTLVIKFLEDYFSKMKEKQLLQYINLIKNEEKSLPEARIVFLSQFNPEFNQFSPKCDSEFEEISPQYLATYFLNTFVIELGLRGQVTANKKL